MTRPARLAVGVVSAGRGGSGFGAGPAPASHPAAPLNPRFDASPPDEVASRSDLVLLALPDDVLGPMTSGLARAGALRSGQIVVHTSGAHGVDVLAAAAEAGALPLALHPVMTFTGREEDLERLTTASVGVTAGSGDEAAWHVGEALTVEMGAEPVRVPEAARPLYHAALAHGANHLATIVADCVDLLRDAGIERPDRVVAPLLSASLDNSLRHEGRALTGPVARGDSGTVTAHLRVLAEQAPDVQPTYAALARRTVARAKLAGLLGEDAAHELETLLDNGRDPQ
ncbi:glycerol-3-phosphate dehydrogenase [Streptomyces regensis]|nr:glycerol-3-phosphate dehydrogenase [Streptomyces regensis]